MKIVVVGGGAAGFFAAIHAKEKHATAEVIILEKGKEVLQKVKISGGGRCNVTHACFDPKELTQYYPRGNKELLGPFHQFMTGDTMAWFEDRGVPLKMESDGRIFPESNSSQSIMDCLLGEVERLGISVLKKEGVTNIQALSGAYEVQTKTNTYQATHVIYCPGSSAKMWQLVADLGHSIIPTVPSLFTFNIQEEGLNAIPGISVPNAIVQIKDTSLEAQGPLLITHWGLSGPAVLKLSAFGARILAEKNYQYQVYVNWLGMHAEEVQSILQEERQVSGKKLLIKTNPFAEIPKRLWAYLLEKSAIKDTVKWGDISNKQLQILVENLAQMCLHAQGKSTFKEEFVTAGGVDLKEINFKRFESKLLPNFFMAGEVLNIDAVTGGFNFQNAWTGGYIIGNAIV